MRKVKNIAIIFAGGVGSRMGSNIPKQFMTVYGKEIIIHTLEKFQYNENIDLIYVGCIEEYIHNLELLVKKYNISKIPFNGIIP
jgi:2-C-methyl-D-erythritol 4-phosphate cytidylyltransferase